jgi:hypothetical protein
MNRPKVDMLAGINLPMLVKLAKVRQGRSLPEKTVFAFSSPRHQQYSFAGCAYQCCCPSRIAGPSRRADRCLRDSGGVAELIAKVKLAAIRK